MRNLFNSTNRIAITFSRLRQMTKMEIIPYIFAKIRFSTCVACILVRNTLLKWKYIKLKPPVQDYKQTQPSNMVTVDQLISPLPG